MGKRYSKYELYEASVQDPIEELKFFKRVYTNTFNRKPKVFREDFCSTFLNSVTWVKSHKDHIAYAVDLASEPLKYGREVHLSKLKPEQKKRIRLYNDNVLTVKTPPVDILTVSNFSICFLRERKMLLQYFKKCYKALDTKGALIIDLLGGEELPEETEDRTPFKLPDGTKADYFWEHSGYNPITNQAKFFIHYKVKGQKKQKKVFTYNWRMWSLPELQDLMKEAGFKTVDIYWEGNDPVDNGGNGIFRKTLKTESCPIWIAFVVGIKR
jgi:hypothetical protein